MTIWTSCREVIAMAIHLGTLNLEKGRVGEIIECFMAFHQEEVVVIGEKTEMCGGYG